jgi:hypothetical protein
MIFSGHQTITEYHSWERPKIGLNFKMVFTIFFEGFLKKINNGLTGLYDCKKVQKKGIKSNNKERG